MDIEKGRVGRVKADEGAQTACRLRQALRAAGTQRIVYKGGGLGHGVRFGVLERGSLRAGPRAHVRPNCMRLRGSLFDEHLTDEVAGADDLGIGDAIVDVGPLTARRKQALGAQEGKVL